MNQASTPSVLRPLGIGEMLDRAVNLCVRNFTTLGLIYVVFVVPLSIIQFYATKDFTALLQAFTDAAKAGGHDSTEVLRKMSASNVGGSNGWTLLLYAVVLLVGPLPAGAITAAVAAFYLNRTTSFGQAYRVGFSRWGHLLGLTLMYIFSGIFVYLVLAIALFAIIFAVAALAALSNTAAAIVGIIVGIVTLVAFIAGGTLVALAVQISYTSCVIEALNFPTAFLSGLKRVFTGIGMRRALPFGLAYLAIFFGIAILEGLGEVVIMGFLKSPVAGVAYGAVLRLITAAFSTAFIVIFYFDLRVREEGLDLQMLAAGAAVAEPLPSA